MNFREFIENHRAFGRPIRGRHADPQYLANLAEATELVGNVIKGRVPITALQEAMTTSDFPLLFGDIIDRQLLANYKATTPVYRNFCAIGTVPDFRTVKRFTLDGAQGVLPAVAELEEYSAASLTDGSYSYSVGKYGRRVPISWETMVNDDLNAFRTLPQRLALAAARSESKFATGLYVDANGPHATLYSAGNKNQVKIANGASSDNPALSIGALQDALIVLSKMVDADGEPIVIETIELVVPPALEVTAQNILNATELWLNTAGGLANQQLHVVNWMKNRLRLNVDPYIPVVAGTANGNTSWFLFANPAESRPAIEIGFLRGHEAPELFMKAPNAQRISGGVDPMAGDFDTDSFEYKVRHVFGGTRMDPKATVASNGSGA